MIVCNSVIGIFSDTIGCGEDTAADATEANVIE